MKLNLLFTPANHIGYGRMGLELKSQFDALGVEVFDHLEGTEDSTSELGQRMSMGRAAHLNQGKHSGRANVALWLTIPSHGSGWWKGQKSCIFTMWEAQRLPESFRDALPNYDTVIVPSMQNLELFSKFHDNVKYVPLGIDPQVWDYRPRSTPTRFFRFLIGGSGKRKGTDLAVKAFNKLWGKDGSWGSGPVPILQMKNPKGEDFYRADGRIEILAGHLSAQEEVDLYGAAHCYLQPSRGEGFGLQPLQAIAQGCPTILTDAHGHASFAHLGMPIGYTSVKSSYFIYGDAGDWWEPNLDELCDYMRWTYENYDTAAGEAAVNSLTARCAFTWNLTANGILDALGPERLGDYDGPDEWYEPETLLYPVALRRNRVFDHGPSTYSYEAGKEYWVFGDVKRILFEGGELDPSCLNDDDPKNCGLAPEQVERAGLYRADHSKCYACGRDFEKAT